jgi:hypothetical protein
VCCHASCYHPPNTDLLSICLGRLAGGLVVTRAAKRTTSAKSAASLCMLYLPYLRWPLVLKKKKQVLRFRQESSEVSLRLYWLLTQPGTSCIGNVHDIRPLVPRCSRAD